MRSRWSLFNVISKMWFIILDIITESIKSLEIYRIIQNTEHVVTFSNSYLHWVRRWCWYYCPDYDHHLLHANHHHQIWEYLTKNRTQDNHMRTASKSFGTARVLSSDLLHLMPTFCQLIFEYSCTLQWDTNKVARHNNSLHARHTVYFITNT